MRSAKSNLRSPRAGSAGPRIERPLGSVSNRARTGRAVPAPRATERAPSNSTRRRRQLRASRGSTAADRKSTRLNSSHGYISYAAEIYTLSLHDALPILCDQQSRIFGHHGPEVRDPGSNALSVACPIGPEPVEQFLLLVPPSEPRRIAPGDEGSCEHPEVPQRQIGRAHV